MLGHGDSLLIINKEIRAHWQGRTFLLNKQIFYVILCDVRHILDNKSLSNSDKTDILDISGRAGKNVFAPRHYEGTKINQRFSGYYDGAKINQGFSV